MFGSYTKYCCYQYKSCPTGKRWIAQKGGGYATNSNQQQNPLWEGSAGGLIWKALTNTETDSFVTAAFLTQTVCLDDTTVKFEIWDTAGQERYHSLAPMYYRGAQAAIIVYDITNQDTFGRAKTWVKELQRQANPNIVIALAGNKADLANQRVVEYEEAQAYAEENGLLFMETSAKTAMNVNDIFLAIAKKLPKSEGGARDGQPSGQRLTEEPKPKSGCCGGSK